MEKEKEAAVEAEKEEEPADDAAAAAADDESGKRKIVIELCNQCNSFKTRANQVKKGLEEAVSGIFVTLNADKPRRGCCEICQEGGEIFISALRFVRKVVKNLHQSFGNEAPIHANEET